METKHTPGPWYWYDDFSFVLADPPQDVNHKIYKGFNEEVHDGKYLICESVPLEANARLIAVAPELLEIAIAARKYLCDENRRADDLLPVIEGLELAIAKAIGANA